MKIKIEHVYTSVACNRTPEIIDWNSDGFICFGATNALVIYNTNLKGHDPLIVHCHHKSKVKSVKWLRKQDGTSSELVSSSADKTAAIWSLDNGIYKVTSTLIGHSDGVTCVYGVYRNVNDLIIFTSSIDSTVKVWERNNGTVTLAQTINLNSGLCLTLQAHLLPTSKKPVLFCALDDHKIHVFCGDEYHRVHTLIGHEDWVRGLDILDVDDRTFLLATGSQDTYIRIWRLQQNRNHDTSPLIKVEQKVFDMYDEEWSVKLDAVLGGHEGWVYGVQWHPYATDGTNKKVPVYRLLSSSLDKTLIIWEPEVSADRTESEGVWVEKVRVGEVGGNGLGFYGSRFGPNGDSFLGHGYNGSLHIWNAIGGSWVPGVACGGHFGPAAEVRWEPRGRYLLSVSQDQTARLHAPWKRPDDGGTEWHEICRPQVHGYDMAAAAVLAPGTYASAADEKVLRVFEAPHNFLDNFTNIVGEELLDGTNGNLGPEGASVPSLGLSNKAVFGSDAKVDSEQDGYFVPVTLTEPPTEETLMQNSLWPETHKLYGHGSEVAALCASGDGALLASAARANVADHAAVLIWETSKWQQIQKLISHQLTVTQLEFSPDSRKLVSVSRDRRWTLYQRREGSDLFDVAATTDKTNGVHTRIIWCCSWSPDSRVFATGSRDGRICVWHKTDTSSETSLREYALLGQPLLSDASVTAVAFAPPTPPPTGPPAPLVIAAGFESGLISIYTFDDKTWNLIYQFDNSASHHLAVKRLAFRPRGAGRGALQLASCGDDHLVRIYNIVVT